MILLASKSTRLLFIKYTFQEKSTRNTVLLRQQPLGFSSTLSPTTGEAPSYLNYGINRTGFLAEATVDTLGHINVITCGPPAAISSSLSFNGNGLGSTRGGRDQTKVRQDRQVFQHWINRRLSSRYCEMN